MRLKAWWTLLVWTDLSANSISKDFVACHELDEPVQVHALHVVHVKLFKQISHCSTAFSPTLDKDLGVEFIAAIS